MLLWSAECDSSYADLLPEPVKLGQREFNELAELMDQIQSMPALPESYFMTEPPPFRMPEAVPPPAVFKPLGGCGGEVSFSLVFYDAGERAVQRWNNSQVIPASRVPEWSNSDEECPKLMMPDNAYNRLINLPSSRKTEKLHIELLKKSTLRIEGAGALGKMTLLSRMQRP